MMQAVSKDAYQICFSDSSDKLSAMPGCVVVTGAASGIGRSVSLELNKKGCVTALWDKDQVRGSVTIFIRKILGKIP